MRTELQHVLSSIPQLSPEALPSLLGDLRHVEATAMARLYAPSVSSPTPDELLDVTQAAQRLGRSTDYLYRNSETFPFTRRVGGRLRFSAKGIEQYINGKKTI